MQAMAAMDSLQRKVGKNIGATVYILRNDHFIMGKGTTGNSRIRHRLEPWESDRPKQIGDLLDMRGVRGFVVDSEEVGQELKRQGQFFPQALYLRDNRLYHVLELMVEA